MVDEFHHAAAATYRRLIGYFTPKFMLGLTATPERTDGGDLLGLCQENLVYRCDLPIGIQRGLLSPFHYYGIPDIVDYAQVPWRSSRFDKEALTTAVATQARAANILEQYHDKAGNRTLAFCCSQRHADFMHDYFTEAGIQTAAVHSGSTSSPRLESLEQLERGEIEVVFSVDMFNEGIDLPNVDTVMMLRPTESRILWLQQFGRGLRPVQDKILKVIDYIGNHRIFRVKPQALLEVFFGLGPGDGPIRSTVERIARGQAELPAGCEITYELETVDILNELFPLRTGPDAVAAYYTDFRERHGVRPLAAEMYHEGYNPRTMRTQNGSWVGFVDSMQDLPLLQQQLLVNRAGQFIRALEKTQMTKSYKMITLQALLDTDALPGEIAIDKLLNAFVRVVSRSQHFREDMSVPLDDRKALQHLLEQNPINALVRGAGLENEKYFEYNDGIFRTFIDVPDDSRAAFQELVQEIVHWRLAAYLDKKKEDNTGGDIVCKVIHSNNNPILKLPDRQGRDDIPEGWTQVQVGDELYEANFVQICINVMRNGEGHANQLHQILRQWFGADAGQPGTQFRVVFKSSGPRYELKPFGG